MITVCFTYFRSLALANLSAALHSLRCQDFSDVDSIVIVDNNTEDAELDVLKTVDPLSFPVPVRVFSLKHADVSKTHSWSTNFAVGYAQTPWVLFTRADYLLDFDLIRRFSSIVKAKPREWDGFITAHVRHLFVDVGYCEATSWRTSGVRALYTLPGQEETYTDIDAGVWMARRATFDMVGGLDERLTMWGHAQTHFQWKLHTIGTEFVRIPEALFHHPQHSAERDLSAAHRQLQDYGINLKELWARYKGPQPYA